MKSVREGTPESKVFAHLITKLNREFGSEDCATALTRIRNFMVPVDTLLKTYLAKYKRLVIDTMQDERRFFLKRDTVIQAVMEDINA